MLTFGFVFNKPVGIFSKCVDGQSKRNGQGGILNEPEDDAGH